MYVIIHIKVQVCVPIPVPVPVYIYICVLDIIRPMVDPTAATGGEEKRGLLRGEVWPKKWRGLSSDRLNNVVGLQKTVHGVFFNGGFIGKMTVTSWDL